MRVILDTNIWCSALLSNTPTSAARRIWNAWRDGMFTAIVSGPILDELARVLTEELEIPEAEVEDFLALLCIGAEIVGVYHQVMGCRDPNDDPFLEAAVIGKADYIVTQDFDLLELPERVDVYMKARKITILRDAAPGGRDFCSVLRQHEALRAIEIGEGATPPD